MGPLMKSSWVINRITLGNIFYMQISTAIIEKHIFLNIVESTHDINTKMESIPMFSWSRNRINTIRK